MRVYSALSAAPKTRIEAEKNIQISKAIIDAIDP